MKHLYTIACLSFSLFTVKAQTFLPAKSTSSNTFTYDFSQLKSNNEKEIIFTITGIANGSTFKTKIDQALDFVDSPQCSPIYGVLYGDPNFVISSGESGVITQNKGTFSITFNPKDFNYYSPVFYRDWEGKVTTTLDFCEELSKANYGIKTAKMTVTLYTPNAKDYIINLSGNSVSVVTGLETETKTQHTTLFYPNPVKDVLHLNQEATIYDAFGKTILSGKGTMDVSGIHSGVYFVHSAGLVQKFVKE